jgi:hypothetical protein
MGNLDELVVVGSLVFPAAAQRVAGVLRTGVATTFCGGSTMRQFVIVMLMVVLAAAPSWAATAPTTAPADATGGFTITPSGKAPAAPAAKPPAEPAPTGGATITPSKPAAPGIMEDQQRIGDIRGYYAAGDFDKALDIAKAFLTGVRDEAAKTEALRITADCLRKKGQWAPAATAYIKVRERYDKASDDYLKLESIAEVMKCSPNGVYAPGGALAPKAEAGSPPKTVADDAVLNDALVRVAMARAKALKSKMSPVQRVRTPQEVMVIFKPLAEQARQLMVIAPAVPPDAPRELATLAGAKMADLGKQIIASLDAKYTRYQPKKTAPGSITVQDKKDVEATCAACKQMAEAEKAFQESLFLVTGGSQWPDGDRMRTESAERGTTYEKYANDFTVPASYYFGWYW